MKFQSVTLLALLNAFVTSKVQAADTSINPTELAEIGVLLGDIKTNRDQYQTFLVENQSFSFPTDLIALFTAITTYTDDSYLTLITSVDSDYIATAITALPWYSTRLLPEMESAIEALATSAAVSTAGGASSAVTSSAAVYSSSVAVPSSSSVVKTSVKSSTAPVSSSSASSAATKSGSSAAASASSSAASSSSKAMAAGNLQATDYFPAMLGVGALVGALLI